MESETRAVSPPVAEAATRGSPLNPGSRIAALDVVRGVALLGILLVNVHLFRGFGITALLEGEPVEGRDAADRLVEILTGTFATGTFLGLFSLLFGIGLALQLSRSQGGRFGTPRLLVVQRLFWLLLIGYGHRQLAGVDILFPYAILGLATVVLAGPILPPRAAWSRGLGVLGVFLVAILGPIAANLDGLNTSAFVLEERSESAQELLGAGGVGDRLEVRALEAIRSQSGVAFLLQILGWMLAGFWVGTSRMLQALRGPPRPLLLWGCGAVAAGVLMRLGMPFPIGDPGALRGPDGVGGAFGTMGSALLVVGVGAVAAGLSIRAAAAERPFHRLAAVGRMALTGYLLQSVLVKSAFLVPGARDALGSAGSLLLVLAVWGFLLAFCPWWMRRYRFGPMEWVWRSLTYLTLQPFRQRASVVQ